MRAGSLRFGRECGGVCSKFPFGVHAHHGLGFVGTAEEHTRRAVVGGLHGSSSAHFAAEAAETCHCLQEGFADHFRAATEGASATRTLAGPFAGALAGAATTAGTASLVTHPLDGADAVVERGDAGGSTERVVEHAGVADRGGGGEAHSGTAALAGGTARLL